MTNFFKYSIIAMFSFIIFACGDSNSATDKFNYPDTLDIEVLHEINNGFRNGEGSFLNINNNSLAYVYTCFNNNKDNSYADICIIKSHDINRNIWTEPEVLIKNHGKQNIMSVSLLRKNDNSILIQYLEKNSCNDLRVMRRYSFDELKTVSKLYPLNTRDGYNVVNNDRLLYYKQSIYTPISRHSCNNGIFVYSGIMELAITDKNDNTTIVSIPNDSNITLQEPGIVNLKTTNNLLMWFRNSTNQMLIATSTDLGHTFTSIKPSILNTVPYSPSSIKSYNNDLFIVYNKWSNDTIKQERTPLALAISKDDLKTIDKEYILENDKDLEYMYTSIHKDRNNLILAYTIRNKSLFILKIVKINSMFKK